MRFPRRRFLQSAGITGAVLGLRGLPLGRDGDAVIAQQASRGLWRVDPDAERVVRDFPARGVTKIALPYRERKEKVKLSNDAKIAAVVFLNLDYFIAPPERRPGARFKVDFWNLSETSEYTLVTGGWRGLDIFAKHGIKATVFANGFGVLKYPEIHRVARREGHEIAAHGWDAGRSAAMYTPRQEADCIRETTTIIADTVGERPRGWLTPLLQCTDRTFNLLADAGYEWHADLRDDDLPYILKVGTTTLIEIPRRVMTTDDEGIWGASRGRIGFDPPSAVDYYRSVVDSYLQTAESWPLMLMFGLHGSTGCLPDRIRAVDKILGMLKSDSRIWLTNYGELAKYWRATYA
jgi:peptidoglycan/xylan/chitin deacetylase (PgdA/CDA1 family)